MRILKKTDNIMAKTILVAGPAKEIKSKSFLGFFRLYGSTGTGLAQPKAKWKGERRKSIGTIIVPIISM